MLFLLLLELFLVLYPSLSSLVSLSSSTTFLCNTLPCVASVCKVLAKAVSSHYSFEISSVSNWLRRNWFYCSSEAGSDCAPSLTYSVCIKRAEYVQIHWESASPKAAPSHRDKCVFALCYSWKVLCIIITSFLHKI